MEEIILASASPRRADLLRQVGAEFSIQVSDLEEHIDLAQLPAVAVSRLALSKAQAVAAGRERGLVIGADTVVVCDGRVLGKPRDRRQAAEMLRSLSGRAHQVMTAVAVVDAAGQQPAWQTVETSYVWFRPLTETDIEAYLSTGEYQDKAGAYGIQGRGALLVERIEGCYFNIVGLPLPALAVGLRRMGVDLYAYGNA